MSSVFLTSFSCEFSSVYRFLESVHCLIGVINGIFTPYAEAPNWNWAALSGISVLV